MMNVNKNQLLWQSRVVVRIAPQHSILFFPVLAPFLLILPLSSSSCLHPFVYPLLDGPLFVFASSRRTINMRKRVDFGDSFKKPDNMTRRKHKGNASPLCWKFWFDGGWTVVVAAYLIVFDLSYNMSWQHVVWQVKNNQIWKFWVSFSIYTLVFEVECLFLVTSCSMISCWGWIVWLV